jgi:hypothetical protein
MNSTLQTETNVKFTITECTCQGAKIKIADGTTTIPANTFQDCNWIGEIILPNSVTTINDDAFRDCTNFLDFF